uniref:MFS domain-containing protein n=1 Tax=Steinernema glaseri TaxID=37863 RepID=A0A1I7YQ66_9BILA
MVAVCDPNVVSPNGHKTYKVYPQRWFVLVTVCLLALSNATIWISYTPISAATDAFYCNQTSNSTNPESSNGCKVNYWMSQIFQIVGVLTGILGMFVTDKYGIKLSCLFGASLNFIGAAIRLASTLTPFEHRIPVLYVGQTSAALAQSFFLCLSPKVAEYWFPEHQRALANALSFVANPLGVAVGTLVPTLIVSSDGSASLLLLNSLLLGLATIVFGMTVGMRRGSPPTPPSASMDMSNSPPFLQGLILLFQNKSFYIQMFTFGFAFALQWSIFVIGDELFNELNYGGISGYIMAVSALTGCLSSIAAGYIVDRTKKFKEVVKFCYIGGAVFAVGINIFLRHKGASAFDTVIFFVLLSAIGSFWIPPFPIGLEIGVETTFPVAEATSSGVLVTAGQLLMFFLTFLMNHAREQSWFYGQYGPHSLFTKNFQLAIDLWCFVAIFATIFTCLLLRPKYRRMEFEESTVLVKNGNDSIESR